MNDQGKGVASNSGRNLLGEKYITVVAKGGKKNMSRKGSSRMNPAYSSIIEEPSEDEPPADLVAIGLAMQRERAVPLT